MSSDPCGVSNSCAIHCGYTSSSFPTIAVKGPDTDMAIILLSLMGEIESHVYFPTDVKKKVTQFGAAGYACVDRFRSLFGFDWVTRFHMMQLN